QEKGIRNARRRVLDDLSGQGRRERAAKAVEQRQAFGEQMPAQVHGLGRRLLSDQAPMVMKGERRAVVDEPGLSPPEEDVRVRRCAVVVHHELVEEQNARSELVGKPAELLGAWVTGAV